MGYESCGTVSPPSHQLQERPRPYVDASAPDSAVWVRHQIKVFRSRATRNTVRLLADALEFPVSFFARRGVQADGFFRSLRSTPASVRRQALARACLAHDLAMTLERNVDVRVLAIPLHWPVPDVLMGSGARSRLSEPSCSG